MAEDNYEEKYTKPDLRRRLKEEIIEGDKGGEPKEWSARKAQLLVQRYEAEGGGYKDDEKDEDAKSLKNWSDQNWQTHSGDAAADKDDGMHRYLPRDAWALLKKEDQKQAQNVKLSEDAKGKQFASWSTPVQNVMTELGIVDGGDELTKEYLYERATELDIDGRSNMNRDELKEAILEAYEPAEAESVSDLTKDKLYAMANELDIPGRSKMGKDELAKAVKSAQLKQGNN